ncbi:MAG: hypothetical protein M1831_003037 [Alyxoria varia]|nr:MAG: hypothetical protein M1831_003037 [Alyxoria varia]
MTGTLQVTNTVMPAETEVQRFKRKYQDLDEDYTALEKDYDKLLGCYREEQKRKLDNAERGLDCFNTLSFLSQHWGESEEAISQAISTFYYPLAERIKLHPGKLPNVVAVFADVDGKTEPVDSQDEKKNSGTSEGQPQAQTSHESNDGGKAKDEEIKALQHRLEAQQKTMDEWQQEAQSFKAEKDSEIEELKKRLNEATGVLQQKDLEIKRLQELGNNVVAEAKAEMAEKDKQIKNLNGNLSMANEQTNRAKKAKDNLASDLRGKITDLDSSIKEKDQEVAQVKSEVDGLKKDNEELKKQYNQLKNEKPLPPPDDDLEQGAADTQNQIKQHANSFAGYLSLSPPSDKSSAIAHEAFNAFSEDSRPGAKAVEHIISKHVKKVRCFLSLDESFEKVAESARSKIDEMEYNADDYTFKGDEEFDKLLVPVLKRLLDPSTPRTTRSQTLTMAVRKIAFQIRTDLLEMFGGNKDLVSTWFVRSVHEILMDSLRLTIRQTVLRLRAGEYRNEFGDPRAVNFPI